MFEIEIYEDSHGYSEILSYFENLKNNYSKDARININKIRLYLNLLEKHGLDLGEPYIKKIDKEIWEIRPIKNRILFSSLQNNKFVLLSVFTKQTRKTPKAEIKKANRLLNDYKKRSNLL